jgi:predicted component of type VI protein secretion system
MNRFRLLAIGSMLLIAPGVLAQQTAPTGAPAKGAAQGVVLPEVGDQLKVLTQKLDLSVDQQPKVKTILQELHDASLKLMQGESTSHEELLSKVRHLRMIADKKIREILSDVQKKKLDQYLQGPHAEMHGNLSGATPPATGKPKP